MEENSVTPVVNQVSPQGYQNYAQPVPTYAAPKAAPVKKEKKPTPKRKIVSLCGIISSLVILVLGICTCFGLFTNYKVDSPEKPHKVEMQDAVSVEESYTKYTSYSYYGGDAYTGIQHAGADASNNAAAAAKSASVAAENAGIAANNSGKAALATKVAAENAYVTNQYLGGIIDAIAVLAGIFIAALGLLGACYFANKFFDDKEYAPKTA